MDHRDVQTKICTLMFRAALFTVGLKWKYPNVHRQMRRNKWDRTSQWNTVQFSHKEATISLSFLKFMPIESVRPSNHLILCRPIFLLPSIFSNIRIFSSELALRIRWPKYLPSNEYSGSVSSRVDWFDLLAVQGTLRSLLQHHSSKASILPC